MDMLNNLIVGLISQCIRISKYHIVYLKHNNNFVHQLHFSKASGKAKTGNKTKILFLWLTTKNFQVYKNNLKETLNIYIWTPVASRFGHFMGKTDKGELSVCEKRLFLL